MKRIILFICFNFILSISLSAHGYTLKDHSKIKEFSSFRIQGTIDLRIEKDISSQPVYKTLNHEGGMQVRVLEILKSDKYEEKNGRWLYVLLTSSMWVDSGEWVKKYQKFLIFLPDDMPVYDFED